MAHEGYHEPVEKLSAETQDFHRAIISLIEELEARPLEEHVAVFEDAHGRLRRALDDPGS